MNMELQRFARHTFSAANAFSLGSQDDSSVASRLLNALRASIQPHLRWNEALNDLLKYQILLESQYELRCLVQVIEACKRNAMRDRDQVVLKLLYLARNFVAKAEPLQEKAIVHYRSAVCRAMDEGRVGGEHWEKEEEELPTPMIVRRGKTAGLSVVQPMNSMETSKTRVDAISHETLPKLPLAQPLFDDGKVVKDEPLDDFPRCPPPVSTRMTLRKRKQPVDDHYEQPSTSNGSRFEFTGNVAVKEEPVESMEDSPNSSNSMNGFATEQTGDHSLLGVFSKEKALELTVPWDGMGKVDEDSNIGQPSSKSCPFCPQNLIGKRSAITRHVKEMHKDLWPEFAPIKCPTAECDYRATNNVTMKAHINVSHGAEWEQWKRKRWFDLPKDSHCPFCPERRRSLKNLSEYVRHMEKEHLWDVADKPRSVQCRDCRLIYQHTNELFFHWMKRGNTCSQGAVLVHSDK